MHRGLVLLALLVASRADAQSVEAEALFNQGDSLMKQSKFAEACEAFDASNRLEQRAGTLIRLGECRERNLQLASAWSAYKDALTRAKDPKKKAIAAAKVKELEPRLSQLTVKVATRIDGLEITRNGQRLESALWNLAVPVNGGTYTIVARAPKKEDWKTTIRVEVEKDQKTVEVPALKDGASIEEVKPIEPPPQQREVPTSQPEQPSQFTTQRKIAVGLAGGGVVGLAIGIVLGTQSKAQQADARALCPQPDACLEADQANALIESARGSAIGADIAFGVAGAAAIGAVVLWLTGAPTSDSVAVVPGPASLTVMGRF